jgi:hypothetical protein
MVEKRRRTQLKFNNDIRDWGLKQELRVGSKKIFHEAFGKIHELEVVKRAVRISVELRKVSDWILWRCRPPPKRKKRRQKHSPRKRLWWWYIWTGSQLIREPLGTSGLKEGEARAVGEYFSVRSEPGGRIARPITDVTSTALGKKKWR